jgi:VanZ family protein
MVTKNIFSLLVALIILFLSLASSETFENVSFFDISYMDKIVHFGMYLGLMSVIIFENRNSIKTILQLFLTALIPFSYGILMEVLQSTVTTSRSASLFDVIANSTGILTSVLLWLWIKPHITGKIRS